MPVHADSHGQIKMPQATVGVLNIDKPAIGTKLCTEPSIDRYDLAAKITRCIDQMTAVRQHKVLLLVGLGIACRFTCLSALQR